MGRVAKKAFEAAAKAAEDSPTPTITQTRARRTPKPNPKYTNESIVILPKVESSDTPGSSDVEDKPDEIKVVKSVKKAAETPGTAKGIKTPATKGKATKKQKLEYDADEKEDDKEDDDDKPAPTRSTRSKDPKDTMKVGDDSVAIVDVSSIMSKGSTKTETPKNTRGPGRKRAVPEDSPKEDQVKKKKEEEKPSLITARKSYMPSSPTAGKKADKEEKMEEEEVEDKKELEAVKSPANTRPRRNAGAALAESPLEKKVKVEPEVKVEEAKVEVKKLPMVRKYEQITKVAPTPNKATPQSLPTKIINNNNTTVADNSPKPVPRILNSMITPKGKQSPNIKLAGDGTDKKVFSIDLTDDTLKEKRIIASPVKPSPIAVKENIAINKPQPSMLLKHKLESELTRMKASANYGKRYPIHPHANLSRTTPAVHMNTSTGGARRITKFESWYVIDVKNLEPTPFRHTHSHSLIKLGNSIKDLQLPSSKWDYKVTLTRRQPSNENNNDDEDVYSGEVNDKSIEGEKHNYEPCTILFKRSHRESNKVSVDRSLMLKSNMYTITMNGKQCKLVGAPDDITSIEDIEILLSIIDSSSLQHSCVELVTNNDNQPITIT